MATRPRKPRPRRPHTLEQLWSRYWREREAGGSPVADKPGARDAFVAGALSALLRARQLGSRDRAWREALRAMAAEHLADAAASVGLVKIDSIPPRGTCS